MPLRALLVCLVFFTTLATSTADPIRLHWSKAGDHCWYRADGEDFVVDVARRSKTAAYDKKRLAKAFSKTLSETVSEADLKIESIAFSEKPQELILLFRGEQWLLTLPDYTLTEADNATLRKARQQFFLPPRNSKNGGEPLRLTIENQLEEPIDLFWVTTSGEQQIYATIDRQQTHEQPTFSGHVWLLKSKAGLELGCFVGGISERVLVDRDAVEQVRRNDKTRNRRTGRESSKSPDGKWNVFVRNHDLWIRSEDKETRLSFTGSAENSFGREGRDLPDVRWSPDSKYLVAFQTTIVPKRKVYLIESTPEDQLQPKLHNYSYRKPGDELPVQTVHLFSVPEMKHQVISNELFPNPWSLRFRDWSEASDRFSLHYNQRGHQLIRELEVIAHDGKVRTIIEEASDTFIQYSNAGKSTFERLGQDEILWASERDGWNHLYRYSRPAGEVLNQVTSGTWNVRRIEHIDREKQQIWFYSVGIREDQDPYYEHFCRVNYDGSEFQILTEGDGTHQIEFQQAGKFIIDTYSCVDQAPVQELRDSESGELICELSREDAAMKFGSRRLPTRFVAKGRDGETDIWGIIHWPINFAETKTYPVVENIYAGPHDQHVPKAFRTRYYHQHQIADAGMIVVQIDGMGTAWRSKAFHDVCFKNLRDAGFPDRIAWIKAAAKKFPQMDLSRVGIYGGSAGGQNAMAALLWHNEFYKVAVADCGCHDNRMDKIWWNEQWMGWPVDASYADNSNSENSHLLEGKLMLIVGELDRNVDPASTTQVVRKLIQHDKDFEFVLVPGVGHGAAETPWASRKRLEFLTQNLLVP